MRRAVLALIATVLIAGCGNADDPAGTTGMQRESPAPSAIPSPSPSAQLTDVITPTPTPSHPEARVTIWGVEGAVVTNVLDGDTIEVEVDGTTETVRLIGVDAPYGGDATKSAECFGREATDYTTRTLIGITVRLERDAVERDDSGRLLAYVILEGRLFNVMLVRKGFAVASAGSPNVKYAERFTEAQEWARAAGAGLWWACGSPSPEPTETIAASAAGGP